LIFVAIAGIILQLLKVGVKKLYISMTYSNLLPKISVKNTLTYLEIRKWHKNLP